MVSMIELTRMCDYASSISKKSSAMFCCFVGMALISMRRIDSRLKNKKMEYPNATKKKF